MILRVTLLLLCSVLVCQLLDYGQSKKMFTALFSKHSENTLKEDSGDMFQQNVDHFDATNTRTFYQRYYYNTDFFKDNQDKQIVLLFLGTEGEIDVRYAKEGFLLDIAKELNALIVVLEHRHYGKSLSATEYNSKELSTLTTQQALADIVTFRWHIRNRFSLKNDEWITIGGSTAGMLAAWARIKFPHFVKASFASSAPIKAKVRFKEFGENIAKAFKTSSVGGSQKCLDNIKLAFKNFDTATSSSNAFSELEHKLSACNVTTDYNDLQLFAYNLVGPFAYSVIYNGQYPDASIREVCRMMTKAEKPIDMLAEVVKYWLNVSEQVCIPTDYKEYLGRLASIEPSYAKSWYYQKCREFGFFETCECNCCPFSRLISPAFYTNVCPTAFRINDHLVSGYAQFTNDYYGAEHPGGSRIIYTHGSLDPWKSLGVLQNHTEAEIYSIHMNDVAHCGDIHLTEAADTPEITKTKQFVLKLLKTWFA